jgi:hypothetical protein
MSNFVSLISDDLVNSLDGKQMQIGIEAEKRIILAERQRLIYDSQGIDFYIEVCGPWPEEMGGNTGIEKLNGLHFVIEAHITKINDAPPADPATVQIENVGADLAALIMADITRGGNALQTEIDGLPYYVIVGGPEAPEIIIRLDIIVKVFSLITD